MNIDFRCRSIEIDKEKKVVTPISIDRSPGLLVSMIFFIEIDDDFSSIVIDFVNR